MSTATTVVVGAGAAGANAALALRAGGEQGRIVLLGEEPHPPYRRPPLSKDVLQGRTPPHRTALKPVGTYRQQGVELRTGARVEHLDLAGREVVLADGERLRFDRLLLATGGRPRSLPGVAGSPRVHVLRGLDDAARLRAALRPGGRLLVVGGGLVGLEVAASARVLGVEVTVLEAAPRLLGRVAPPVVSHAVARLHRDHGVRVRTGAVLRALATTAEQLVAVAADGARYEADAVLVAVGMRPDTRLAAAAGIDVSPAGVVVDARCRTSARGVWAAGDLTDQPNSHLGGRGRLEHWQNAQDQGAAAARSMLGDAAPYAPVPWCWSEQHGVALQTCGWPDAGDQVRVRGDLDALEATVLVHRAGRLVGAVAVGGARRVSTDIRALRRLIAERPDVDPDRLADPLTDLADLPAPARA